MGLLTYDTRPSALVFVAYDAAHCFTPRTIIHVLTLNEQAGSGIWFIRSHITSRDYYTAFSINK